MTEHPPARGLNRALSLALSRASVIALFVLVGQVAILFGYLLWTKAMVVSTQSVLYPIIWITLGVWLVLVLRADGPEHDRSLFGLAVAGGYLLALAVIGDMLGTTTGAIGGTIISALPGWGPIVRVSLSPIQIVLVPFEVVGYLALSYGVYRAIAASKNGFAAGFFGLFSCVGCSLGLLGAVASAVTGATVAVQPAGYGPATAVYALTVILLVVTLLPNETECQQDHPGSSGIVK